MFKGESNISFKTDKSKSDIFKNVEDQLNDLAPADITESGVIKITSSKFNTFGSECTIDGTIRERDGKFTIDIEYEQKPNMVGWIAALCSGGLLFVLLVILFINNKNDIGKKLDKVLNNIRMDYK